MSESELAYQKYVEFLYQVFNAIVDNQEGQFIQALLRANRNKLDYTLIEILQNWWQGRTSELLQNKPIYYKEQLLNLGAIIVNFGIVIADIQIEGTKINLEIAIAALENFLELFTLEFVHNEQFPEEWAIGQWAIAQYYLANVYLERTSGGRTNNLERAVNGYGRALQVQPDWKQAWLHKGRTLLKLERFQEAITSFDRALAVQLDTSDTFHDAWIWYLKGIALGDLGNYEESIVSFDQALKISPDYSGAWVNRGTSLYRQECYEDALYSYDKAIEFQPENASIWLSRGFALRKLGNWVEAADSFDQALRLEPNNYKALECRNDIVQRIVGSSSAEEIAALLKKYREQGNQSLAEQLQKEVEQQEGLTYLERLASELANEGKELADNLRNNESPPNQPTSALLGEKERKQLQFFQEAILNRQWKFLEEAIRKITDGYNEKEYRKFLQDNSELFKGELFNVYVAGFIYEKVEQNNLHQALKYANSVLEFCMVFQDYQERSWPEIGQTVVNIYHELISSLGLKLGIFQSGENKASNWFSSEDVIANIYQIKSYITQKSYIDNRPFGKPKPRKGISGIFGSLQAIFNPIPVPGDYGLILLAIIFTRLSRAYLEQTELKLWEKNSNEKLAIKCCEISLAVWERTDLPTECIYTHNCLAKAYSELKEGNRAENIDKAIYHHEKTLESVTRSDNPDQWATTQNNLGVAYRRCIRGNKSENLKKAISCYEKALEVRKQDVYPTPCPTTC